MKTTLGWAMVWMGVLAGGYWISQRVLAPPPVTQVVIPGGAEIVVPAARDGHFYLDGAINGVPLRFMVDTGASYISVDAAFARRARLPEGTPGYFNTANGSVEGRLVGGQSIRVQDFVVNGLTVAVMPADKEDGLLGQNFLRQFDVSQSGGQLRLRARTGPAR